MSQPLSPLVLYEADQQVARVTLNRPERRNALSQGLLDELGQILKLIEADAQVRVVVLQSGGPVFCSGHDLGEMAGRTEAEYRELFEACSAVMLQLQRLPQPVIARVHGLATAAGCQLVAACDLAVASDKALFATPGVKIGLFCSTPMVPIVRRIIPKVALEMLLTGQPISAERALQVGLLNAVTTADKLDEQIAQWTTSIIAASPMVVALGKRAYYEQRQLPEPEAYTAAIQTMTANALHGDAQEGITAFLQKRSPVWGK
jgi:enoyl-CoA hydratase/carnithine racemase